MRRLNRFKPLNLAYEVLYDLGLEGEDMQPGVCYGGGGKGGGAAPAPPTPIPPPVIEDTQAKGAQDADALRRRQGRASTVLGGKSPDAGNVTTATKALLGN